MTDKNPRPILTLKTRKLPKGQEKAGLKDQELKEPKREAEEKAKVKTKADTASGISGKPVKAEVGEKPKVKLKGILHNKAPLTNEEYDSVLKYLQKTYPNCFPSDKKSLPLAIGIHKQLFAISNLPFSRLKVRKFLGRYTRSRDYRRNLIVGNNRIDLQGNPTTIVTEEEVNRDQWKEAKAERQKKARHDSLIKKAMEQPLLAREFLEEHLPEEYKALIDLSTLKPEKESYVEESLKTRLSDIVFSVQISDKIESAPKDAFIYTLIEHQVSSDHWLALRLWKYSLLLLERHASKKDKLPLVLPLVIYNGKGRYKAPKNIFDLFAYPDIARKVMAEDYKLIDLQAMDDSTIDYEKRLSFLLYVMKHIHARDMLAMIREAMSRCRQAIVIDKEQNYILTKLILWYADAKVPEKEKHLLEQLVVDNLPQNEASSIMKTIADSYIEEGFNKGMIQGIEKGREEGENKKAIEIAKNLLSQKIDIDTISSATGLAIYEIQKLI